MAKLKFTALYFDEELNSWEAVNEETGEVREFTINTPKKVSTSKKKVEDLDPVAKLTLDDNKYVLNNAAVKLMSVNPDDKLEIKYERTNHIEIPVIGTNEAYGTQGGNRLTKSFTVSCRGKANERLSNYGNVFTITPHTSKEGIFILTGDKTPVFTEETKELPEDIEIPSEVPFDLDMLNSDNLGADTTEVLASDFDFSF